ncbi:hypothetical protein BKA70DRAFT_1255782 [Coprinopsis sp. MPI-PUGE-AT-0042]|nr:hypothetical protein BKA70DRAFT_1255782 [Coprinopsis sp. MPI-PUGE-AT-0042]
MDIPPEIAAEIISFVQKTSDLCHIALSCRAFCSPAQRRIFGKIDLFKGGTFSSARFKRIHAALKVNPSLGGLVHELSMDPVGVHPESLVSFLQNLQNLRSLHLESSGSLSKLPTDALGTLKATLCSPSLARLSIARFSEFPIALLKGATSIKELEVLTTKSTPYPQEIGGPPDADVPLSKLASLCLQPYLSENPGLQLSLLLELIPRNLKRLHLNCRDIYEHLCATVLEAIGKLALLEHFVYSLNPFSENNFLSKGSFYPSLRHVEIDLMQHHQELGIEGESSLLYFHHPTIVPGLEQALLQEINFPLVNMEAELRKKVESAMPALHERGALRALAFTPTVNLA